MIVVIAIEEGEIKIYKGPIDYAPTVANCYFSCFVAIATEAGLTVEYRGVGEVFPVKSPIPVAERAINLVIVLCVVKLKT